MTRDSNLCAKCNHGFMDNHVPTPTQAALLDAPGAIAKNEELCRNYRLLVIACLFTVVGGYMDAYAYLAHGHVFANAQTGNIILLAVDASAGQWAQAARHVPPIVAFALGVATAQLIGVRPKKREFRATLCCQAVEFGILVGLAIFAGRLPNACVVPCISFVAALQNTSFSQIGTWSFTSPMTTGNLRKATSGLTLWLMDRDPARNRGQAVALYLICLSFLVGAVCGSFYTRWDAKDALLPCVGLVAAGLVLTWRERRRRARSFPSSTQNS